MDNSKRIAQLISELGKAYSVRVVEGDVVSVDGDTCTVDIDGLVVSDVRLRATPMDAGGRSVVIYPSIGSSVLLSMPSGRSTDVAVIQWSEVDKVVIGDGKESVTNGTELKKQLETMSDRVQALFDALINSGTDPQGGIDKVSVTSKLQSVTTKEDFNNIEDKTLLH